VRNQITEEIRSIEPFDALESLTIKDVLAWLESDADIYRIKKPDIPNRHLVSYFVVVDGEYILLVDHINAELWLPTGGHVEPGENPRTTVVREAREELTIDAVFFKEKPVMISNTTTVGRTSGHVDVSLWYAIKGNRSTVMDFDTTEFHRVKWFHKDDIPYVRTDPELYRFLAKFYKTT